MYYDIDPIRREYLYSLFINNRILILDWPRNIGKSKYSLTCILDYAINHPHSKNIVIGHDTSLENLKQKLLRCNQDKFNLIHSHSNNKITLKNDSIIYFSEEIRGDSYDTVMIDEQGYVKLDITPILNSKIITNGTSAIDCFFSAYVERYSEIAYVNKYEKDLLSYLRLKKIEKIKNNI